MARKTYGFSYGGKTYRVFADSQEEAERNIDAAVVDLRKRQDPALESLGGPTPGEFATPEQLPQGGTWLGRRPTAGERFEIGGAEGVEEIAARLGIPTDRVWKSPQGRVWAQLSPGKWSPLNPRGLDLGDFAQMANDPAGVGAALATLTPGGRTAGILGTALRAGLGGTAGQGVGELSETVQGTQRQNLEGILGTVLGSGAQEAVLGGIGARLGRGASPLSVSGQRAMEDVQNALALKRRYPQLPEGLAADLLRQTGFSTPIGHVPAPAAGTLADQANRVTGAITAARSDKLQEAVPAIREIYGRTPQQRRAGREAMDLAAQREEAAVRGARRDALPGLGAGAFKGSEGLGDALEAATGIVRDRYVEVKKVADEELPEFDLTRFGVEPQGPSLVRTRMVDSGLLDASGAPVMAEVMEKVSVMEPGPGVQAIRNLLKSVDPEQMSWEALQALRTQVGEWISHPTQRGWKDAPSRKLYGELSEVLKNPKNSSPGFVEEFENATRLADWKAGMASDSSVRKLMDSEGVASVIQDFANNPNQYFTPKFRELMNLAPEGSRSIFRRSMQQAILDAPNPLRTITNLRTSGNEAEFDYMFSSPAEKRQFLRSAEAATRWEKSPAGRAYQAYQEQEDAMAAAIEAVTTPEQAQELLTFLNPGEREMVRSAVVDRVVNRSMKRQGARDEMMVNSRDLENEIDKLQDLGLWDDVLTQQQKEDLRGLASYQRVFFNQLRDSGSGLENASLLANLRGMIMGQLDEARKGYSGLLENKLVSKAITNKNRYERMVKRLEKKPGDKDLRPWAAGTILLWPPAKTTAVEAYVGINPETDVREVPPRLRQGISRTPPTLRADIQVP